MKVSKYSTDYSTKPMPELNTFPSNFRQELMLEGILASIGSVGDAYDCQSVLVGLLVDSEDLTSAA